MIRTVITGLTTALLLTACVTPPPEEQLSRADEMYGGERERAEQSSRAEVPADVRAQLRRGIESPSRSDRVDLEEPRFAVQAREVPAADFFARLTNDSPFSIVVHPDVTGAVTLNLRDVTLQETLDVVQDIYGFDIRREGRIYRVFPAGLRTETISLNYLSLRRQGISQTSITSGGVAEQGGGGNTRQGAQGTYSGAAAAGPQQLPRQQGAGGAGGMGMTGQSGSMIMSESETDFWKDLESALRGVVGEGQGRSVVVSRQAGLATVRAYPHEIRAAKDFLASAERSLQRQVILEARIVEVELSERYQQGVDWTRLTSRIGDGVSEFSFSGGGVESGSLGGVIGMSFQNQTFSGMLEMLSTQGNVQVLSSPRVTATNNQKQ